MKQYNVMDYVACKHDMEAMLSKEKYWKTAQFICKDYTKQKSVRPHPCVMFEMFTSDRVIFSTVQITKW